MAQPAKKHSKKVGLLPGSLVYVGEKKIESVRITVIDYNEQTFQEKQISDIKECSKFKATPTVTWINIDGIHRIEVIEAIGEQYGMHSLVLEDILNTGQRPKFEDLDNYIFVVVKMLNLDETRQRIQSEQLSLILGSNFIISFQESAGDIFEQIRDRIRTSKGRVRKMGADYLAYTLLDAIVDNYFLILESFGEKIEFMEEELATSPTEKTLRQIYNLKKELISLRKSVWPLRELIGNMRRSESSLINASTDIYLEDVYDHTIRVIDTVETFRDVVSGMLDLYLSSISNRTNAIMKILTIIATLFIPLTFLVGVYGMNFKYMPELQWRWSYPAMWVIIILIVTGMLTYFRKKKWL